MRTKPTTVIHSALIRTAVAALGVALLLAGCDTTHGSATAPAATGSASQAAGINAAKLLDGYSGTLTSLPTQYPAPPKSGKRRCVVGWLSPVQAQESVKVIGQAMAEEGQKLGCQIIVTDANLSVNKQVSNVDQLISQGVTAIVYYALDANALAPALTAAAGKGIKIIGLQVSEGTASQSEAGTVSQVWHGLDLVAYEQMKGVAQLKPHAKVGLIGIGLPVPSLKYQTERERYWASQLGLTVVAEQDNATDDPNGGQQAASALLAKHPGLDAIVAYNDSSAFGAYSAAQSSGHGKIIIVGCNGGTDAAAAVRAGRESMSIKLNSVTMGQQALIGAYDALQGVSVPKLVITRPTPVTPGNVSQYRSWAQDLAALKADS